MKLSFLRYIAGKLSQSAKRQRFINFARGTAFMSVMLGSMALIISLSVLKGFEKMLMSNAVNFTSHIMLFKINSEAIENTNAVLDELKMSFKEIKSYSPIIEKECLISHGKQVEGIILRGINASTQSSHVGKHIIKGGQFSSDSTREIIIGERLANKMNVSLGEKITIFISKNTDYLQQPEPIIRQFVVKGIYKTGMAKYDDIMAYIPFRAASDLLDMGDDASSAIELILHDVTKAGNVSSKIESQLGFPYFSRTVYELHSSIFAWIDLQKEPIPIVLGLISIVAVMNILTAILIIVVEKTHTIGILRALGMRNLDIIKLFLMQGLAIGTLGSLSGALIGLLAWWIQNTFKIIKLDGNIYFLDVLPMEFDIFHYLTVISISIIMTFVASFVPAFVATRFTAVSVLKFR